ncbi:hypothetical protein LEP1GSC132_2494 [Leptospira kirschneri str. 200803703]|uniref:hypothetical protein n=1 Tax=Leptospira kirschneri TaxID=29507 RepID=UPI0002BF33E6|nr:hypothetical protein [Leptospira kirschneri]EMO66401.1 hypothetical protein LEP1GSC132_2494 [Leptospira kirschneri str. 200803703]
MQTEISLTSNEIKTYYQNVFQKINADDINRLSGALSDDSYIRILLTSILYSIGRNTDTAIGYKVSLQNQNTILVGNGIFIKSDSVYIFPEISLTPNPNSVVGIFELEFESVLTDEKSVAVFNSQTERFQPQPKPTRKTYRTRLYEQWLNTNGNPLVTPNRNGLLRYTRSGGNITNLVRTLPVYDPKLVGVDVVLNPNILDNTSLSSAINWLYNYIESKNFIKTTPSSGFDNANFRIRTQGNFAYWSKDEGANWLPFA